MEQDSQTSTQEQEQNAQNTQLDAENPDVSAQNAPAQKTKKPRIWEIDFLRGFCVYLMVLDHLAVLISGFFAPTWYGYDFAMWDAFSRFCYTWFYESIARKVLHPIVVFIFFALSGISCTFSRSNLKRGGILAAVALLYTLATYAVQTIVFESAEVLYTGSVFVTFGVLHCLAFCILTYAIMELSTRKTKYQKWILLGISSAIIIVVVCLYFLYTPPVGTPKFFGIVFPPKDIHGNLSPFYVQGEVSPGDLFSLIPYSAFFFAGVVLGPLLYGKRRSLLPKLDGKWHLPFTFVGRYALYFYLGHLLLLAGILELVTLGKTGSFGI